MIRIGTKKPLNPLQNGHAWVQGAPPFSTKWGDHFFVKTTSDIKWTCYKDLKRTHSVEEIRRVSFIFKLFPLENLFEYNSVWGNSFNIPDFRRTSYSKTCRHYATKASTKSPATCCTDSARSIVVSVGDASSRALCAGSGTACVANSDWPSPATGNALCVSRIVGKFAWHDTGGPAWSPKSFAVLFRTTKNILIQFGGQICIQQTSIPIPAFYSNISHDSWITFHASCGPSSGWRPTQRAQRAILHMSVHPQRVFEISEHKNTSSSYDQLQSSNMWFANSIEPLNTCHIASTVSFISKKMAEPNPKGTGCIPSSGGVSATDYPRMKANSPGS